MTRLYQTPVMKILRSIAFPIVVLGLPAAACAPSPDMTATPTTANTTAETASVQPPSAEIPQVLLPDGYQVTLELAITPDELSQGLMFRPKLPEDRGMLLIFAEDRLPSIWMMNTLVALDLVYLDSTGTVVDVITDAQPCPGEPCPRFTPKQPAKAVLEISAGGANLHAIEVGTQLEFLHVPEFSAGG